MLGLLLHGESVLLGVPQTIMKMLFILDLLMNLLGYLIHLLAVIDDEQSLLSLLILGIIDLLLGGRHIIIHLILPLLLLL